MKQFIVNHEPAPTCTSAHVKAECKEVEDEDSEVAFMGGAWTVASRQLEAAGEVEGVQQPVLLDTGASMCLVSPRLINKDNPALSLYIEREMRPTRQRLRGCLGKAEGCRGVVAMRIKVGGHEWTEQKVYVLDDCPHPLIISWPTLVREDFRLQAKEGRCQFGNLPSFEVSDGEVQPSKSLAVAAARSEWHERSVESTRSVPARSPSVLINIDSLSGRALRRAVQRAGDDSALLVGAVQNNSSSKLKGQVHWAEPLVRGQTAAYAPVQPEDTCRMRGQTALRSSRCPSFGAAAGAKPRQVLKNVDSALPVQSESAQVLVSGTRMEGALENKEDVDCSKLLEEQPEPVAPFVATSVSRNVDSASPVQSESAQFLVSGTRLEGDLECSEDVDCSKLPEGQPEPVTPVVAASISAVEPAQEVIEADARPGIGRKKRRKKPRRKKLVKTSAVECDEGQVPSVGSALRSQCRENGVHSVSLPESVLSQSVQDSCQMPEEESTLRPNQVEELVKEEPRCTRSKDTEEVKVDSKLAGQLPAATETLEPQLPEPVPASAPASPSVNKHEGHRYGPSGHSLPSAGLVNVMHDTVIPPMSERNVVVNLVNDGTQDRRAQYLFEPTPIHRMRGKLWRAAACLTQRRKNGDVMVRVMNPTNVEVPLYPGVTLGTWEHLSVKQVMSVTKLRSAKEQERRASLGIVAAVLMEESQVSDKAKAKEKRELSALDVNKTEQLDPLARAKEPEDVAYATKEELRVKVEDECQHLSAEQRGQLLALLERYQYTFRKKPGRTDVVQHRIDTGDSRPIRGGRYRQSEKDRETIREIVKDMTESGVVRPSRSPWGASVVLVPKKDGTTRFCVDYRRLNEITLKDVYPLPRIDATLDQLGGCKYFTAMDLTSGYWQVDMKDEDAAKTAFLTPDGLYEFTAMPFGLCNAPATFQRLMDQVLGNMRYEFALVYLDDVMVHSKTFEEHVEHLDAVLECLTQATLACKLKKCSFAQESTAYLGHVVSARGIEPEPSKIAAVKEMAPPRTVKEIRMFLGFVGYYRRFINNFSAIAKPLNHLLRKAVEWQWGVEQQDAFEQLRDALISAPILQMPDFKQKFTIRTDASYLGLGACLLQGDGDDRQPIAYASRSLKPAETRYTATEIECLGMKWAVNTFRPYVHGRKFTLETDHIALKWLRTVQHNNARLIRTAMELQQYDMEVVHRAGIKMYDADALSRLRRTRTEETGDETAAVVASVTDQAVYYGKGDTTSVNVKYEEPSGPCKVTVELLQAEKERAVLQGAEPAGLHGANYSSDNVAEWLGQVERVCPVLGQAAPEEEDSGTSAELLAKLMVELEKDPYYSKLYRQLSKEDLPEADLTPRLRNDLSKFVVKDGYLYRIEQLYRGGRAQAGKVRYLLWIPESLRQDVLFACHDHVMSGGHLGVQKTFARLRIRYYWTGMFKAVEDWCKSCEACASRKDPVGLQSPLSPLPVPREPFQMVSVDVLGPFVAAEGSGNRYVLVYCDHLTRWVETIPFRRNDSAVMARVLVERIMCRHGAPATLLSDRGRPFMSALAKEVYRLLRVKKVSTAAYRPQTNGLVERFNRTLAAMLSMYVDSKHKDWDRYLPYVTFAYNTTAHSATKESPFFLLYGREARLPIDNMLLPVGPHEDQSVEEYRAELVEGLRIAHEHSRAAMEKNKQQMEQRRGPGRNVPEFVEGELVKVKNPALQNAVGLTRKLTNAWTGPFKVLKKMGPTTYLVTGVAGRGRAVNVNRLKKHYEFEHAEVEESDYANHFATAGEPAPSEGNRTYAPAVAEGLLPPGDGEAGTSSVAHEPVVDAHEEPSENLAETQVLDRPSAPVSKGRGRPRAPKPTASRVVRRVEPGPELGLVTPVAPCGGLRNLCKRCHQPKRNHKCKGRYIPARQLTVARRRLGLADPGARPIFGLAVTEKEHKEVQVYGVYAPNDVRKMNVVETPKDWQTIADALGQKGMHIWNEECFKCNGNGQVYSCYGCNLVFHPKCSVRPLLSRPLREEEEFMCPDCLRDCVDPNAPTVEVSVAGDNSVAEAPVVAVVTAAKPSWRQRVQRQRSSVPYLKPRWRSSWGCRHPGASTWSRLRRIPEHGHLPFSKEGGDRGKFFR